MARKNQLIRFLHSFCKYWYVFTSIHVKIEFVVSPLLKQFLGGYIANALKDKFYMMGDLE